MPEAMTPTGAGAAMVRLTAPEGATSCSCGGVNFKVSKKGFVTVPATAVADLFAHGFTEPGDAPANDPDAPEA